MPELPEVEVTRRRIEPFLVGRTVARVHTSPASYFFLTKPAVVRRRLAGRTFVALSRLGKYLLAELDDQSRVGIHLGMTGQLFAEGSRSVRLLSATARAALAPEEQPRFEPDAHTHLRLAFKDEGPGVLLRDVRKFGKVFWMGPGASHARLDRLGGDALELTGERLRAGTRGRRVAVKARLLDQALVAGVGNIYADEALFLAGVRPGRRASRLTRAEAEALARSVRQVLIRSIETGGASISDFVGPDGADGHYQDERHVYGRTGEPCRRCRTPIARRLIVQRSSHYCPWCQT